MLYIEEVGMELPGHFTLHERRRLGESALLEEEVFILEAFTLHGV